MARPNGSKKVRGWIITPKVAEKAGVSLTKELSKEDMEKLLAARRETKQEIKTERTNTSSFAGKEIKDSSGRMVKFSGDGRSFVYYISGNGRWSRSIPVTKEQGDRLATGKTGAYEMSKEVEVSLVQQALGGGKPQKWMSKKPAFSTTPYKSKDNEAFTLLMDRIVRSQGDVLRIGQTDFVIDRVNKPSKKNRYGTLSLTDSDGDKYKRNIEFVIGDIRKRINGETDYAFEIIAK